MAKVSICIPAYNQVKYLRRTIQSVLNQSYQDYEIIITDDSPTNIVFDLVKEYQLEANIQYYKNEVPLGSPENWNESIEKSSGEYIKIMHHDDYFSNENSLFEFVKMLDENPTANFAFCATVIEKKTKTRIHCPSNIQIENLRKDPNVLFFGNFVGPPSSIIHRRDINLRYDKNLIWVVDLDFYMQNLTNNSFFVFTDSPLIINISGEPHNVTRLCENNKNVEIYEYLYLFEKISKNNQGLLLKKVYIIFFKNLFLKYKIQSIKDIHDTRYKNKLHIILKLLIILNMARMYLSKYKNYYHNCTFKKNN